MAKNDYDKSSEFTNASGAYLLTSLFVDFGRNHEGARYCLGPKDHPSGKYINLHKAYLDMEDATEWDFAHKYFANWEHWTMICNSPRIAPYIENWRRELEIKLRSRALKEIVNVAQEGGNRAFEANKFLVSSGWLSADEKKETKKRGRPTKESVKNKAVREFIEHGEQIDEDFAKLMDYKS